MLRRLYDWLLLQADKPYAVWVMAGISFVESSFFPIPPDLLLIPMMLKRHERIWWFATVATLSSVIGGYLGYALGYFIFNAIGDRILEIYGLQKSFADFQIDFQQWGIWAVIGKGLTPIPYKIVTIACGVLHFSLIQFTIGSIIARGIRFYLEATAFHFWGDKAKHFIETRLTIVTSAFAAMLVGGFLAFKYIHLH